MDNSTIISTVENTINSQKTDLKKYDNSSHITLASLGYLGLTETKNLLIATMNLLLDSKKVKKTSSIKTLLDASSNTATFPKGPKDPSEDDPKWDPSIPRHSDGTIDVQALENKLERMLRWIKTHPLSINSISEFLHFIVNVGQSCKILPAAIEHLLSHLMGTKKSPGILQKMITFLLQSIYVEKGHKYQDLLDAYNALRELVDNIPSAKDPHSFFGKLKNMVDLMKVELPWWADNLKKTDWSTFLTNFKEVFGNIIVDSKINTWLHAFYKERVDKIIDDHKNNPAEALQLLIRFILANKETDQEMEIEGQTVIMHSITKCINQLKDIISDFSSKSWTPEKAKDFMEKLHNLKNYVDHNPLLKELKGDIDSAINTILNTKVKTGMGEYTLEEMYKYGVKHPEDKFSLLTEGLKNLEPNKKTSDPEALKKFTAIIHALNKATTTCTNQNKVKYTLLQQMTSTSKEYLSMISALIKALTTLGNAITRNERS